MDMKPMVYSSKCDNEILFSGTYRDYKFLITNGLGNHPSAFIENKFGFTDEKEPQLGLLDCHGGVKEIVKFGADEYFGHDITWLKISYNLICDFKTVAYERLYYRETKYMYEKTHKKYTTEEVLRDIKHVIDQIYNRQERGFFKIKGE